MRISQGICITFLSLCFIIPTSLQANPVIDVNPNMIEDDLSIGEVTEHVINISNNGDETLQFSLNHEIIIEPERDRYLRKERLNNGNGQIGPIRDNLGDVVAEHNIGRGIWSGLAWDGELMWGVDSERRHMIAFDPVEEQVIEDININNQHFGMVYDGEFFWVGTWDEIDGIAMIQRIDQRGNVNLTLDVQGWIIFGVAFDGENLWYISVERNRELITLRQITTDGQILRTIDCSNIFEFDPHSIIGYDPVSIEWVADHNDGHIWALEWSGSLMQLDVSGDAPQIVQQIQINTGKGIGHDGENIWYASSRGTWFVLDDGIREIRWISYDPIRGEVEPNSEDSIFLTLDATELIEGEYWADLHVISNDPVNSDIVTIVSMIVECNEVIDQGKLPVQIDLSPAYPNPFNSITRFSYTLPEISLVSIKVYDINGGLIETLVKGDQKPGRYETFWSGSKVPAGAYIIRMETDDVKLSRKVMLVK